MKASRNYWWINADPKKWRIEDYRGDFEHIYTSHNKEGNKRRIYSYFSQVKPGDLAVGYQTSPMQKVIVIFEITKSLYKDEKYGDCIKFVNKEFLPYQLSRNEILNDTVLADMEVFKYRTGSLFKLTETQFNAIVSLSYSLAAKNEKTEPKQAPGSQNSDKREQNLFNKGEYKEFSISETVDPVIGVKELAAEVALLIKNLQTKDKGKMIGIFGKWGRGKTFLMEQIWKELDKGNQSNDKQNTRLIYKIDFQAWKYQDTPASWAYLYEAFAWKYFQAEEKTWFRRISKCLKLFRLNIKRIGLWRILLFFWAIFIYCMIYGLSKLSIIVIGTTGIALTFLIKLYSELKSEASNLLNRFFKKPSFVELLGIQAEIQKELRDLLTTWISDEEVKKHNTKVLVVVDDIDRCSEERIIQVIDSLRVMLEDEEISRRVVVMAAVDERVLKRAIKWKYHDLLEKDFELENNSQKKQKIAKILASEYMDKLFLSGIKLGTLTGDERRKIFGVLTKGKVEPEKSGASKVHLNGEDGVIQNDKNEEKEKDDEKKYELSAFENKEIEKILESYKDATPRQIRIFYYRYLLARNLVSNRLETIGEKEDWGKSEEVSVMGRLLLHFSLMNEPGVIKEVKLGIIKRDEVIVEFQISEKSYKLKRLILIEILNVLEMVIAY
jgi:hypothetical protein